MFIKLGDYTTSVIAIWQVIQLGKQYRNLPYLITLYLDSFMGAGQRQHQTTLQNPPFQSYSRVLSESVRLWLLWEGTND